MAFNRTAVILAIAMTAMFSGISESLAGTYDGYVTARSDYGNGTVRAPVRQGQFGYQVKLPGGSWIYCTQAGFFSRSHPCADTLRRQSLDFWEAQQDDHGGRR
jgi:hypothetical protein